MAIDESAGVRDRKDAVVKSSAQSYALAVLLSEGPTSGLCANTAKALLRRGWIEKLAHIETSPWAYRWHLTETGRAVAEASPAVREWIEGWESYRKRSESP
jgi:hypothetical protein